jgi:hypothetical protein
MEAMATCSIYINQLLVMDFTEATTTFISYRDHVLTEASAPFLPSTNRLPPRPWMVARYCIYSNKVDPFDWFILVCWMGSREELPRLHPESLHSG